MLSKTRGAFGPQRAMLVSDRGMITDACINVCTPAPASQLGLDIGVRHHAIRKLAEDGVFLRSLFDERGLVEIASDACLANAWWCAATRYSRSAGDASARNCSRPPRPTPSTSPAPMATITFGKPESRPPQNAPCFRNLRSSVPASRFRVGLFHQPFEVLP